MEIDIKETLNVANKLNQKEKDGGKLVKGEKIILTLAKEYVKMYKKSKEVKKYEVSDKACVDIITFYKKRAEDTPNKSIDVNRLELNIILDALLERIYE